MCSKLLRLHSDVQRAWRWGRRGQRTERTRRASSTHLGMHSGVGRLSSSICLDVPRTRSDKLLDRTCDPLRILSESPITWFFFFFFFFFCFLFFFVPSPAWSDIVQKPLHLLWLLQLQLSSIHRIDAQESSGRLPVRSAWPAPFPFALGEAEGKAPSVQPCRSTKEARSGEHGIDELNTCLL